MNILKRCAAVLAAIAMLAGTAAVPPESVLPDRAVTVYAETLTSGDYRYEVNDDDTVTITKYTGSDAEVVIPSELDGKKVTGIGSSAFSYYTTLTSVTIPDSVTSIGKYAFSHCAALTAVTIPEGVTNIEDYAFCWTGLTSVTIPEGVTSIGNSAFSDCTALTSAAIPEGVTSIGKGAFANCAALTSVTIPESVTSVDGFAFYDTALTSVTIPGSVTSVGGGAFGGCQRLTNVTVLNPDCGIDDNIRTFFNTLDPDNDTYSYSGTITGYEGSTAQAYAEKYGYTFVSLDEQSTTVPYEYEVTDDGTVMITKYTGSDAQVVIPDEIDGKTVTSIGEYALFRCEELTSVTIPASVTTIGRMAFQYSSALTTVTIPEGVTDIESYAFEGCTALTSITIPASVTRIGASAFSDTPWLDAKRAEDPLVTVNGILIDGSTCEGDVTIPEDATSIGAGAFAHCSTLTSVTIPASVTSIGECAFMRCSQLNSVTILNPDCDIYEGTDTISNGLDTSTYSFYYTGTISGYEGSTAQAYAELCGYTFVSLGKAQTLPLGDLDGNDNIDSIDAAAILTASALEGAGLDSGLTSAQQKAADVDKSGHFDSVDAAYILQYSAYLGAGLGSESLEEYMQKQTS